MKSMCKHWGLHISTDTDCLGAVLGSFWAVWRGLLWCLKAKLRLWWFPRYWRFNKRYHGGYQLICLISRPLLIASRRDWYRSKGFLRAFRSHWDRENWWRIDGDMAEWSLWQEVSHMSKALIKRSLGSLFSHLYLQNGVGTRGVRGSMSTSSLSIVLGSFIVNIVNLFTGD